MRIVRSVLVMLIGLAAALVAAPAPASAADPGTPGQVAFVRGGNIFVASIGGAAQQVTTGGDYSWPRLAPLGNGNLVYLHDGDVYTGYVYNGQILPELQLTHGGGAGGASYSPDSAEIAYIQNVPYPVLYIARLGSSQDFGAHRTMSVRSVTAYRLGAPATPAVSGSWTYLRQATAVAWSPDGRSIAFPGGDCTGVYDSCLSVVDLATNTEYAVRVFGGGGDEEVGYATVPQWTADSAHLLWTEQSSGEGPDDPISKTQIWESNRDGSGRIQVGVDGDSLPAPSPANDGSMLITAGHNGQAWVTLLAPNGHRTYLWQGFQEDWAPAYPY